eukprot:1393108-Amorphochlora_amoeboformis.AAC.2
MGSACSRRDGRKGQVHEEDTRQGNTFRKFCEIFHEIKNSDLGRKRRRINQGRRMERVGRCI